MILLPDLRPPAHQRPYGGRPSRVRHRGQALVEFALIVPILMFILVIAIDFGRLFYLNVGIINGAREGAAYGADHPTLPTTAEITTRVRQELGLSPADPSVTVTRTCSLTCFSIPAVSPPNTITITASTTFSFLTPFINTFFGGALPMSAASTAVIP